jgi:queuine tRNA-ribosyltransferase
MYTIIHKDNKTKARTGIIKTAHGDIKTPFFMPVATKGSIKYIDFLEANEMNTQCRISNALINSFNPGLDVIKSFGGLHNFSGWHKPLTTDSGGFQLLSDSFLIKTTKEGAYFRNPFTNQRTFISPERLIEIQEILGSDIAMILDDVCRHNANHDKAFSSMVNTHEWARRAKKSHKRKDQLLFGIAQGGMFKDLRRHSCKYISSLDFEGIALGGLAIGEPTSTMYELITYSLEYLPENKPKYLMGVGNPLDIIEGIRCGVDMFDSIYPTKNARHNTLFTFSGTVKLSNAEYRYEKGPIDKDCNCIVCKNYSAGFVHHLMKNKEATGKKLCSYHNLYFMQELMRRIHTAINTDSFESFYQDFKSNYTS